MDEIDTLLTTRQLQDLLQIDRITIYRMLNDGRLQGFKVGGQWRFPRRLIEKWLAEQRSSQEVPAFPQMASALKPSAEALPLSCMRAIQDVFAEALDLGCVTTAVDGTPLTPVANSCEFCNLILGKQAGRQRCINSWRAAAEHPGPTSGRIQDVRAQLATCHAGLIYVWGEIIVREKSYHLSKWG
jgi:excisionase family DNA binding protein